ncbi:MAG: SpoIIE family protein phosphatase [Bacteroidales bacterium]|nr:SpoIIE family protein phosphatase [Bacteroidales bacterium]MBN2697289.1 SpoIIE family protein phosphatase [Bacteroidales bacterium]
MRIRLIFMLWLSFQLLNGQQPVVLSDYVYEQSLTDFQFTFLSDPSCRLEPADIFSEDSMIRFRVIDLKDTTSAIFRNIPGSCIWFRFVFINRSNEQFSFHLQPNIFSEFEEYTLYQRFQNGVITARRSGNAIAPRLKDVNISGSDELRFYLPPGEMDTMFLRVQLSDDSVLSDLTFTVSTHDSVISRDRAKRMLFGVVLGIMLIMILYHIPLYIKARETSYLYYMLYILAFLLYFLNKEGYIYELTPKLSSAYISMLLLEIFLLFFLLFGKSYLDTAHTLKVWDNILLLAVYFTVGGLVLSFSIILLQEAGIFVHSVIVLAAYSINILSALGSLFLAIVPAMILTRDHVLSARFFLFANLFLILGILATYILKDFPIGKHSLELGVTLQILTFSVGLGERINVLKRGREIAQRKIIEQLRENAALKDKVTRELEDKVQERTREIQMQKEQIEKQNKEIKYSFDYAKKIQSTVLPTNEVFDTLFSEHFIFFKPRDIVSGDFYWISQKEHRIILTAADCTGHGVPGSLMSMLGITMLHEIVNEKDIIRSDEILNQLRLSIARTLKQEGRPGEQKDGIDMALMIYDSKKKILEFSGANNPLYIIRDGEMLEYKGNNMPVAYYDNMSDFTRYTIEMKIGDRIYLFTDGFPDQFGGPEGKKFKYRPFKDMLLEVHDRPMDEQHKILSLVFDEWKGDLDQIDDILIIGLRL